MKEINFDPFPVFQTKNIVLRCPTIDDIELLHELRSHPVVNKYLKRTALSRVDFVKDFFDKIIQNRKLNISILWVITLAESTDLIGTICLWNFSEENTVGELGYELHPDFHGKGIMSEAIKLVLQYGFKEIQFQRIDAYTYRTNKASIKLLEKHNFACNPNKEDKGNKNNAIYSCLRFASV